MAIIEDTIGGEAVAVAGFGAGILVLVPTVLRRIVRPAAKALIKGGIVLYRGAAEIIDEAALGAHASPTPQRSAPQRSAPQRSRAPRLRARHPAVGDKPKAAAKQSATRKSPRRGGKRA